MPDKRDEGFSGNKYRHWRPSDAFDEEVRLFRERGDRWMKEREGIVEDAVRRLDDRLGEQEEVASDDCAAMLELLFDLGEIVRLYDRHNWEWLAGEYDSFAKAVDSNGDFRPVRLNVADLFDEILCKHNGDWVRGR